MKKINIFLAVMLCLTSAKSQLYYSFSVGTSSFNTLNGATVATLTAAFTPTKTLLDESFVNNVPIGFTFQYNGRDYTQIHLNSNGYASLAAPFIKSKTIDPQYEINELSAGSGYKGAIRPILAPFWDNLVLSDKNDISYQTSGNAPNRIFTAQWLNMKWESGAAAISFQLKLYEADSRVEFIYRSEAGTGGSDKSASTGITTAKSNKILFALDSLQFLSVRHATTNPAASRLIESFNNTKPATGQFYRFSPLACVPPDNIHLMHYNDTRASIDWNALRGVSEYEFALSNEDVAPNASTITAQTKAVFDGLIPNTTYYFYLRSKCGTAWSRLKFTTADKLILPFEEGFETAVDNMLPATLTSSNNKDAFADIYWQTTDAIAAPEGSHVSVNAAPFSNTDSWMFTPSFFFKQGISYTLKFRVSSNGGKNKLFVKYGRRAGADSMIFDIFTDSNLSNTTYRLKQATITPAVSGNYIIGFAYRNDVNDNMLYLDDISIKENVTASPIPFAANLSANDEAKLSWQYATEEDVTFILERSKDGNQFKEFGRMEHRKQSTQNFEYWDRKPAPGVTYYRVSVMTNTGNVISSNKDAVQIGEDVATMLYPNPSPRDVFVKMQNTTGISIRVFNLAGNEVPVRIQNVSPQELKIIPTQALQPGVYMVHISNSTQTIVLKWIVL